MEVSPSQDNSGSAVLLHAGWWLDDPEEPFALLPRYCLCWFVFKQVHKTRIWKIDLWSFMEHNKKKKKACSSSVCVEWSYWTCIVVSLFCSEVLLGASKSHKWKTNKQLTFNETSQLFENDFSLFFFYSLNFSYEMYHHCESFLVQQYWLFRSFILWHNSYTLPYGCCVLGIFVYCDHGFWTLHSLQ